MNAIGSRDNIKVISSISGNGIKIDVLEYERLDGSTNMKVANNLYFMGEVNIRARQVVVYLDNNVVKLEPGAMSYYKGNIDMISGVNMGNIVGRVISGALTGEKTAQPVYSGTGMIVLEPSFKHFIALNLYKGERIIVDKGMFVCAEGSIEIKPIMNNNISSALLGGEGIFQMEISGPGIVVLEIPVPMSEIDIIELNNEALKVDGNFALLRTGDIKFTVERSAKTLLGSAVSGEGLVNVFNGTGKVWLAPTLKIYKALNRAFNYRGGDLGSLDMNTSTNNVIK